MRARLSLLVAMTALGALLVAPIAHAQEPALMTSKKVALTGTTKSGKSFKGTYTIDRFKRASGGRYAGQLVSIGTVRGRSGGKRYAKRGVVMPARVTKLASASQTLPPLPNSCGILDLRLGPINLDLLGLVVRTNAIQVRIDAQRGPGNLLGNLLCGITGALDPGNTTLGQLGQILNAILALLQQ